MDRTITVTGSGRATVVPDVGEVRLGVSLTRPTVAEARDEAARRAAAVLRALEGAGVDLADVRTASLSVQPEYDHGERPPRLRGHQVAHQYQVTVRDVERLAGIVDGALAAGATTLDGVAFRASDMSTAERDARIEAVRAARARAEVLAAEAGVTVGEVVSISEVAGPGGPRPLMAAARLAMAEAAPTPIEAGTSEVVASVVVTFAIAG